MTRLWLQKTKALVKTMKLPPHAVGHHLIFDVPVAFSGETVYEVKSRLLSQLDKYKSVNYVYVLSKNYVLKGVFSFSEVFISPPGL
jgi:Mg/Co/Ni transporter MgtE